MKRRRFAAVVLALACTVPAAARQGEPPPSRRLAGVHALSPKAALPVYSLPAVDREALLAADAEALRNGNLFKGGPLRFAVPAEARVTPQSHGRWETLADGSRLWRLRFVSAGATDLNFGFSRYRLPAGATLHVVSEDGDTWEGPYTYRDNEEHGQLWTPVVAGEAAVLELWLPAAVKHEPELELSTVGTGYRDFLQGYPLPQKQGSCNNDVVCPEADPWRDQVRSVALYTHSGGYICTGNMVNDVAGSFRPFFLTANHCIASWNAPSMVVYWNYESPTCGALSGGSLADNQTGAVWRAARYDVDFALVELDDAPEEGFNVFWSGWDRTGAAPWGSVGIHHPLGDEKAISFNDDPLTTMSGCVTGGIDTHWRVDNWEDGTTEPGSSGSGLWDPDNQLLVGFLTGGYASCTVIDFDCYGKLAVAWKGTSSDSRLRDWLDPENQGALAVQGADPQRVVHAADVRGNDRCFSDPGRDNGVWEPGEMVEIAVDVVSGSAVSAVRGTLSSLTPGVRVVDGEAAWPDLLAHLPATSLAPHFTVLLEDPPCFGQVDFQLRVTAGGFGPHDLFFTHLVGQPVAAEVPQDVVDGGTTSIRLEVADDVVLTDVDVAVDVAHTYVGDLRLALRSPSGTEVVLLDRPGVPATAFGCGRDDMTITFDDASAVVLEDHCVETVPWYSGPAAPVESLGAFNGEPTAGTWTLTVTDHVEGDTGSVLDLRLLTVPPLADVCEICPGPTALIFADGFESGDISAWSAP